MEAESFSKMFIHTKLHGVMHQTRSNNLPLTATVYTLTLWVMRLWKTWQLIGLWQL